MAERILVSISTVAIVSNVGKKGESNAYKGFVFILCSLSQESSGRKKFKKKKRYKVPRKLRNCVYNQLILGIRGALAPPLQPQKSTRCVDSHILSLRDLQWPPHQQEIRPRSN